MRKRRVFGASGMDKGLVENENSKERAHRRPERLTGGNVWGVEIKGELGSNAVIPNSVVVLRQL